MSQSAMSINEARMWLAEFERTHARPLRVLHIGNIANNAYNNAQIQRQRGIDAYVLSFDYYHIMATPEWEDADFVGDVGDPFMPDWHAVDLNGFKRPRWFVAGPLDLSLRYLLAHLSAKPTAPRLWQLLEIERWMLCRRSRLASATRQALRWLCPPGQVNVYVPAYSAVAGRSLDISTFVSKFSGRLASVRRIRAKLNRLVSASRPMLPTGRMVQLTRFIRATLAAISAENPKQSAIELEFLDTRLRLWTHPLLPHLFKQFDVVQCYATYTAMPYLLGRRGPTGRTGYLAYEHGTIRSLPFEDSDEGRLCAASYRAAARVCVTNTDNLVATERLEIAPDRVIALPHAFDDVKLIRFAERAAVKTPPRDGRITFFTPARQDWTKVNPGYAKYNDRIFWALKLLQDEGQRPLLKAVEWGADVEASKRLIATLSIGELVQWVPTMKKKELWQAYLESHAVVDQFCSPALGGVSFETMVLGRRLITHLDRAMNRRFFGEEPPVFYAETVEEIATAMRRVLADPTDVEQVGIAAQRWMQRYHSADRITALQVAAYRDMVR